MYYYDIKACEGQTIVLGRLGENLWKRVIFDVSAYLDKLPDATVTLINKLPNGTDAYPVANAVLDGSKLVWTITATELTEIGVGQCELIITSGSRIAKSIIWQTYVSTSLDGSGDAPEPWDSWQAVFAQMKDEAQAAALAAEAASQAVQDMGANAETLSAGSQATVTKLVNPETGAVTLVFGLPQGQTGATGATGETGNGIASIVLNADYTLTINYTNGQHYTTTSIRGAQGATGATGADGKDGENGADGFSPTVSVTNITNGHRVTITDKNGSQSFDVTNGENGTDGTDGSDGADGFSPTVTVTDITGGHRITITDATGAHSFDVMDGEGGGVTDVQVSGTSVVQDGVANVPLATDSDFGVVKTGAFGVTKVASGVNVGKLCIDKASVGQTKAGTENYKPITPSIQDSAAFYGFAKAAGDTTQSASSNAVGTYTENAKSKISEMLSSPVSVTGTTPTITALSGIQYVCGEVLTLDITLPASGIIDVVFTSGSTPTVLTITPSTGMTVEWANGFDSTALEADTLYELNIKMVGTKCLGVAGAWS